MSMKLKPDELAMLNGEEGKLRQEAMKFLVELGEVFGAEEFVDIDWAFAFLFGLINDVPPEDQPSFFNRELLEDANRALAAAGGKATVQAALSTDGKNLDAALGQVGNARPAAVLLATAGSATMPRVVEHSVTPSWAVASIRETCPRAHSAVRARASPASARGSSWLRREEVTANSAPTKKALPARSATVMTRARKAFTGGPPRRRRTWTGRRLVLSLGRSAPGRQPPPPRRGGRRGRRRSPWTIPAAG